MVGSACTSLPPNGRCQRGLSSHNFRQNLLKMFNDLCFLNLYAQSNVQPDGPRKDGAPEWMEAPIWRVAAAASMRETERPAAEEVP